MIKPSCETLHTQLEIEDIYDGSRNDILIYIRTPKGSWSTFLILQELERLFGIPLTRIEILGAGKLSGRRTLIIFSIPKY